MPCGLGLRILNALALFIQPPDLNTLKERLIGRSSDSEEKIQMRLDKAEEELAFAPKFDKVIINDLLDHAIKKTLETVKNFLND